MGKINVYDKNRDAKQEKRENMKIEEIYT